MSELTPLGVLLHMMRKKWKDEDYDGAVALAKIAAPYLHGRVPASRPRGDLAGATDAELDEFERQNREVDTKYAPGESV